MGTVEAGTPIVEFAVVWDGGESCFGDLSLMNSQTPEEEKFDVGIDILFVEVLVFVLGGYKLFLSRPAREDKGKGGEGVCCKDHIAEERSREDAPKGFEVDDACGVIRGKGRQVVDHEASVNVLDGGEDLLDGEDRCPVVDNYGDGYRACPGEASDFVCWVEEGPAKTV